MLGSNFNGIIGPGSNWPDCGEIDIMEYTGKEPDRSWAQFMARDIQEPWVNQMEPAEI